VVFSLEALLGCWHPLSVLPSVTKLLGLSQVFWNEINDETMTVMENEKKNENF
jgi:hypothetical protein